MAIKRYYAYVTKNMASLFEEILNKKDKVKLFSKEPALSENGEPIYYYVIEAEEGLIDPKWELK